MTWKGVLRGMTYTENIGVLYNPALSALNSLLSCKDIVLKSTNLHPTITQYLGVSSVTLHPINKCLASDSIFLPDVK
jgi:hypothetical protein